MNLRFLVYRIRYIILQPSRTWEKIKTDTLSEKELFTGILVPFSVLVAICSFLGSFFVYNPEDTFSLSFVLLDSLISFIVVFLESYFASLIINELAGTFQPEGSRIQIYKLVIFSQVPFYLLLAVTKLFPQLLLLLILGFYSFYLFWTGSGILLKVEENKRRQFVILSSLIMIISYFVLYFIFRHIYLSMIHHFNTLKIVGKG